MPDRRLDLLVLGHAGSDAHPAVVAADATLTFSELRSQVQAAAAVLAGLGVTEGSLVAVCLPRSAALVVAQLAVMHLGGAYVALDPAHPAPRLAGVVADSGAPWVIAGRQLLSTLTEMAAAALPGVGAVAAVTTSGPRTLHEPGLAYVIYTSGSTGTPKGVLVPHEGVLNLADWHARTFGVKAGTRCSLIGGPGFDAAAWETWGTLVAGATLVIPAEELKTDPGALRDWLITEGIEVAFAPTPLAETLLALRWPDTTPLRVLLTGGDRLRHAPPAGLPFVLVNNYGVTEASVVTTSGSVAPGGSGIPSIGAPIPGVATRVVDEALQPAETGELLIGGVSLARGYLNRPELTAAAFITLQADDQEPTRWYRTGDLVKRHPDSSLDYLGRRDAQVQVRGFRVEPGEIEAALDRHPAISRSVVLLDAADRLIAYLEAAYLEAADPASASPPIEDSLRHELMESLPSYMMPAAFVWLEAMPVTANGKIDRSRLAVPTPTQPEPEQESDELLDLVGALVAELLGVPTVAPQDNFLLLGGHSLMGAQLVIRLSALFGVDLSLRELFDDATPAGIAGNVRRLLVEQISQLSDEDAAQLSGSLASEG